MKIIKVADQEAGSAQAAELFAQFSGSMPNRPVGLATGGTMAGVYRKLQQQGFRVPCQDAFALDEYLGIDPTDKNSYLNELGLRFSDALGWSGKLHVPGQGDYAGPDGAELFEQRLTELGPVSVQLLGLGSNGHIAFNEPGSAFDSRTRVVELHPQTRSDNARFFDSVDQTPTHATTQGLATIAQASNLLLLVFGEAKRAALGQALAEPGPMTPLAALLDHPSLTLITELEI